VSARKKELKTVGIYFSIPQASVTLDSKKKNRNPSGSFPSRRQLDSPPPRLSSLMVAGGRSSGDETGVYHPGSKMSKEAVGDQPKADELEMQLPSAMSPLPPEKSRLLTMLLEKKVTAGCVRCVFVSALYGALPRSRAVCFGAAMALSPGFCRKATTIPHLSATTERHKLSATTN
jgi:hypothetical protein